MSALLTLYTNYVTITYGLLHKDLNTNKFFRIFAI